MPHVVLDCELGSAGLPPALAAFLASTTLSTIA
jgi:hypothetical protein